MTDLATAVDRLQAVPLEDFVSERKRLAKELRAAGDRDAAAELAKLPKPTAPAWALNHLAREEPDALSPWLEAAEALRDASARAGEVGGAALRTAMAEHREAMRSVIAAVRDRARPNGRELSEPMVERVRELLQAATLDPEQSERLRAGLVVEGGEDVAALAAAALGAAAGPGESGAAERDTAERDAAGKGGRKTRGGETAAGQARGDETRAGKAAAGKAAAGEAAAGEATAGETRADTARARKARAEEERRAQRRAELEARIAEADERLTALRDEAAELEAAAARAEERLEEAQRTLHRSESEAAAARDAAGAAAAAVDQTERELRTLTAKLSS